MTGVGRLNDSMNYMQVILQNLMSLTFSDVIDIAVVSFLIYQIVKLVRETSSTRIIRGVIILIAAMWLSSILQLTMVNYLFKAVLTWGIVVMAIVFQPRIAPDFGARRQEQAVYADDSQRCDSDGGVGNP